MHREGADLVTQVGCRPHHKHLYSNTREGPPGRQKQRRWMSTLSAAPDKVSASVLRHSTKGLTLGGREAYKLPIISVNFN